ncbi:mismatch-specific DNA-glycosylase [uncultured Micrococcus sp.]|uniref:mismatch-specific DNA-glycosylase n=1 Tax=uncultured Micrococcus sp. TaxID=114051 RepID=UPI0025F0D850|nr:mismatch-specific DNA-glycosylase [uncultured Micrococcus sp.]
MSYTQAELQAYRDATVPDLLPDPLRLLFIGINPSLWSAATGAHFGRPGNRFYPALHRAGLTRHLLDASAGYRPQDHAELHERGIGISNLVPRATARADELTRQELEAAPARLDAIVAEHAPAVVAVLGVGPYRLATGQRRAQVGEQASPWPGARLFVAHNPSGLNAHATVDSLGEQYREIGRAAGIVD